MQVRSFCLQHSTTFDISHAFLRVTIAELLTLKQVRFFWPTLYMYSNAPLVLFFCKRCLIFDYDDDERC